MRYFRVIAALSLSALCTVQAAEIPRSAPNLNINLAAGKQINLNEYRGKTVVLAFILTYCSHCQAVIRGLIKDQQDLGPKGLQVVAAAIEDMAATAVPGFIRQFAPTFPVGYTTSAESIKFLQHPPVLGFYMPALVFIDKEGVIRFQAEGRDPLLNLATQEKSVRDKIIEVMGPVTAAPVPVATKKKKSR